MRPANTESTSFFNGAWQSKEILKITGEGGSKLHGKLFKKTDPDVVDSDVRLDQELVLVFPQLTPESQAINLVKAAVITVPGRGRSATNIQQNVQLFMKTPGLSVGKGWSAKLQEENTYLVTLDFINGQLGPSQAIWSADVVTKKVQYINKYAKDMSWVP